jgi:Ulp1 family protease
VHIYSGLFYPALRDDLKQAAEEGRGAVVGGGGGGGEELAWRRTMTFSPTSVDPFMFDFLLVPVCEHLHWYLAVVCHPRRLLRCSGALLNGIIDLSGEEEAACIAIVDSLSSSGRRSKQLTDMLRRWLRFEHQRRHSPLSDVASQHGVDDGGVAGAAPERNVDLAEPACTTVHAKMPLQTNVVDCGLFVCMNAMHIVRDLDVWYREAVVEGADLRSLYDPKVASGYRQVLQHHMAHFASLYAQHHPAEPAAALGLSSDVEEIPGFSQ